MVYFRDKFRTIFLVKDSPRRIALAFAIGVFMGISPLLGFHYIIAFILAWTFRLNKLVAMVGVSVNNPWTILPISSFSVWFGAKLTGIQQVLPKIDWVSLSFMNIVSSLTDPDGLLRMTHELMPLLRAFFVGSFVICTLSAIASYFIIYRLVVRYR